MVTSTLILDLVEAMIVVPRGQTVEVPLRGPDLKGDQALVTAWCLRTGNELVEVNNGVATLRRGLRQNPLVGLAPNQVPGTRLWMYTNFDCNLACDYCCVRSSPRAERRALGVDRVRRLANEAVAAGVVELVLTGGEPFQTSRSWSRHAPQSCRPHCSRMECCCTAVGWNGYAEWTGSGWPCRSASTRQPPDCMTRTGEPALGLERWRAYVPPSPKGSGSASPRH